MLDINPSAKDRENSQNSALVNEAEIASLTQVSQESYIKIFCLIILAIFVIMAIWLFILANYKSNILKNKELILADLQSQLQSQELKNIAETTDRMSSGLKQIASLMKNRSIWSAAFGELQTVTPSDITLRNFLVEEKDGKAKIEGLASSYDNVSLFLAALTKSAKFSQVKLLSASAENSQGKTKIAFNAELIINEDEIKAKNILSGSNK